MLNSFMKNVSFPSDLNQNSAVILPKLLKKIEKFSPKKKTFQTVNYREINDFQPFTFISFRG